MMEKPLNPRDYPRAKLLRQTEPYAFQSKKSSLHSNFPRASQPNTFQPNQLPSLMGWGMEDYWQNVFNDYRKRRTIGRI